MKKGYSLLFYLCLILLFAKSVYTLGGHCSCLLQDTPNDYDITKTETCCSTTQDKDSYFNSASRFCESNKLMGSIISPKVFAECCMRLSGGSRRFICKDILGSSFDPTYTE